MRNNAANPERLIEHLNGVADLLMVHSGEVVVHNDVIRSLKRTARKVFELRRKLIVGGEIDAVDNLKRLLAEGPVHRHRRGHMLFLPQHIAELDRNRSAARPDQ